MIPHNEIRTKYGAMALEEYIAVATVMQLPRVLFTSKREVDQHWEEVGPKAVRKAVAAVAPECLLNIDFAVEVARRIFTSAAKRHVCQDHALLIHAIEYFWTYEKIDFSKCTLNLWTYLNDVVVDKTKEINLAAISELVEADAAMGEAEILKSAIYQLAHDAKTYIDSITGEFNDKPFGKTILSMDIKQFVSWSGLPADKIEYNYLGVRTLLDTGRYSHQNYPVRKFKLEIPGHRTVTSLESARETGKDVTVANITFPPAYIAELADETKKAYLSRQFAELMGQAADALEPMASYTLGDLSMESRDQAFEKHVVDALPEATLNRLEEEASASRYDFTGHPVFEAVAQVINASYAGLYVNKVALKVTGTPLSHISNLDDLTAFLTNFTQESVNSLKETLVSDTEREMNSETQDDLAAARLKSSIEVLSKTSTCLTELVKLQSTIKDILVTKLGQ